MAKQSLQIGNNCKKTLVYDIYLSFLKMGKLKRTINWQDQQATVITKSNVNVFGIGTTYQQLTHFYWSEQQQSFLTNNSQQIMTGFKSRTISTIFFENSTQTQLTLNGKTFQFDNQGKRLFDLDALVSQIRFNVMNNEKKFSLSRQASDGIEHYKFEVLGKKQLITKKWGEIETIQVKQTGSGERLIHWLAPSMDYQTIRIDNKGLISGNAYLVNMDIKCD